MTSDLPMLLLEIPCLDTIKTPTFTSLMALNARLEIPARMHLHQSTYVHDARNKSAQMAIDGGFEYLMFIDSDMSFEPDGVSRLIAQDKDIIGGLYFRRQAPHMPTINEVDNKKLYSPFLEKYDLTKTFEVFSVATGFMLIKTKVLKKIKPPWFGFGNFHGQQMGDDVYFCWKAREHGFKVYCDPTIPLGHVGEYTYTINDYKAYAELRKEQLAKGEKVSGEFDGQL